MRTIRPFLLALTISSLSSVFAQSPKPVPPPGSPAKVTTAPGTPAKVAASPSKPEVLKMDSSLMLEPRHLGIGFGINFSSNGVGINLAKNLTQKGRFAIRLYGTYMPYSIKNMAFDLDKTALVINADIKLGSIGAILDIHPFGGPFKISAGYAMLLTQINATALTRDSTKQGDIMIPPDEVGKITTGITFNPSPYVGIGFGHAVPRGRVGFNFEFGAYYVGQPKLDFKVSGMLEPTSSQESVLQNNLKGLSWLPVLNMGFNFRLTK